MLLRSFNPDLGVAPFEVAQRPVDAGDASCNPGDIVAAHRAIGESERPNNYMIYLYFESCEATTDSAVVGAQADRWRWSDGQP